MKRASVTTVNDLVESPENDSTKKKTTDSSLIPQVDDSTVKPLGNMSFNKRLKIIELNPAMPSVFLGGKCSVRYKNNHGIHNLFEIFKNLSKFKNCNEIAIDGPSGVGKTTLMKLMSREYAKINIGNCDVTNGPKYNISIIRALSYIHFINSTKCKNVVWDRCPFSNLIFYIVHYLVGYYGNVLMPTDFDVICPIITYFVKSTGIDNIVRWEMFEKTIPTLFLVNSNIKQLIKNLIKRGEGKDLYLCGKHNYQYGQLFAYTYFAKMTESPLIDLGLVENVDKCFEKIIELVDINIDDETFLEYAEPCKKLIEIDDYDNKDLVFSCSKK